jgi:hypothetical protein
VLLNLFGFPVAAVLVRALLRMMQYAAMPLWTLVALALAVGIGLMMANIILVGLVYRASGWTGRTIAMAAWTLACIATMFLLGTYSPLNLALALATNIAWPSI